MSLPVIATGILIDRDKCSHRYEVRLGWSPGDALECDDEWLEFTGKLLESVADLNVSHDEENRLLDGLQKESSHWRWAEKSLMPGADEYLWMYLYAAGKPQGVCILYHPKDRTLGTGQIFYIEYLAVAPWNRTCAVHSRLFHGVGTELVRVAMRHAIDNLGLTPGCSLHSLPQAKNFYEKLKMVHVSQHDKGIMPFFELPEQEALNLIQAA